MRKIRQTHTYVVLQISKDAYDEIAAKLLAAGYDHVFQENRDGIVIDMHWIALGIDPESEGRWRPQPTD